MTDAGRDPLDVLRAPVEPVQPDPVFAARLRTELERAVTPSGGTTMPTATPTAARAADLPSTAVPTGVVPYLIVSDGHGALGWYAAALGATETGERYESDEGGIGHAEMVVEGAVFYLAESSLPTVAPPSGAAAVSMVLPVRDVDATTDRAVAAGATLERAPDDNPYGRTSVVRDPYGHRWMLQGLPAGTAVGSDSGADTARPGDLAYATLCTPDAERAAAFYHVVLGWDVGPGSIEQGRQVSSTTLPLGIWGGRADRTVQCCWQVDDVDAAVRRVRAAGGTAHEPTDEPYGRMALCVDDQGAEFFVLQPAGEPGPRTPVNGARHGDLAYLTLEAPDGDRSRAFYAAVLGWRTGPHGDPDVHPMVGIPDTAAETRAVPMWLVDDLPAAVERVRRAGGTASDIEQKPYGLSATCTDDQGMPFYLGNL